MPKPVVWLLAAAIGVVAYIAGTKAGQSRYREISSVAKQVWDDPSLSKARKSASKAIEKAAKKASKKIS